MMLALLLLLLPPALGSTTCPQGKFGVCPSYAVGYGDYCYASMDKQPASTSGTSCQDSYIAMPDGWGLVPYSAAVVTNVVKKHPFSTSVLVFANGDSYYTSQYKTGSGLGGGYLESTGSSHKVNFCNQKVLMRT